MVWVRCWLQRAKTEKEQIYDLPLARYQFSSSEDAASKFRVTAIVDCIEENRNWLSLIHLRYVLFVRVRIDIYRVVPKPVRRTRIEDFNTVRVCVTASGGFMLRKVFYTAPSRLISYQLTVWYQTKAIPLENVRK